MQEIFALLTLDYASSSRREYVLTKNLLPSLTGPFLRLADPCPPENIWVEEPEAGNCSVVWQDVPLVEYYMAFIKRDDGTEKSCNTTGTTCPFTCTCGYTYLTTVFPYNQAGSSPYAHVRNYTTSRSLRAQEVSFAFSRLFDLMVCSTSTRDPATLTSISGQHQHITNRICYSLSLFCLSNTSIFLF